MNGTTMSAVHIRTDGMHCVECPPRIETVLGHLPGVKDVHAYRTMHLTSVLFDPDRTDVSTIRDRIASVGFGAHVISGGPAK